MKSEVFNGQRFWTYFKYDFTQMWRNHVKAAIGIGLAGLIWYFLVVIFKLVFTQTWGGPDVGSRFVILLIALLALELYQTRTYGYLTDRRKGSAWLMIPASTFEKWVSMMVMTLILLPVLFFCSSFLVDSVICLLDPTTGDSMLTFLSNGLKELREDLADINTTYVTTWSLDVFNMSAILGIWCSLLYFLLCGICFKKNKILCAFAILFGISVLTSMLSGLFALYYADGYQSFETAETPEDFAAAENFIRGLINGANIVTVLIGVALAGGIFWRLKTLKH